MSVSDLAPGAVVPVRRDDVAVVVVPAAGGGEAFVRCVASVARHTDPAVPVLAAGPLDAAARAWAETIERPLHAVAGTAQDAVAAAAPADVVLLHADAVVAAGWLDGLRAAAASDTLTATASALGTAAGLLSVPGRNRPQRMLPQDTTLDAAAAAVAAGALRIRPRLPAATGPCVLVRRAALELAGDALDGLSERCRARGLQHVAADDVLVLHDGAGEPAAPDDPEASDDVAGPLGRALTLARRAVTGPRVTIDGRSLGPFRAGTQVHTLELVAALVRTGAVRVRVIAPPQVGAYARAALEGVEVVAAEAAGPVERDEVVHRPFQVAAPGEVAALVRFGERLVVTQQDLIGYRTPGAFPGEDAWRRHRALTREVLALADVVTFYAEHPAADAAADDLVAPDRARLVPIGVDHRVTGAGAEPAAPAGLAERLGGAPFLVVLGTTYKHKNRPFALRLLAALRERHGWEGRLVLAGPEVADGSSAAEEAAWELAHPGHAGHVVRLGAVGEPERAWLYAHAAAVVYPSTYEGFGLVPFEAAQAGTPCLWAPVASLAEVLAGADAPLVPWDAAASADRAIALLRDPAAARASVRDVTAIAAGLTWDRTAAALLGVYEDAVRLPAREAARLARAEVATQGAYWGLRAGIGDTGLALVGPDDPLLPPDAQRALAALARRGPSRAPLLRLLGLAARAGRGGRAS